MGGADFFLHHVRQIVRADEAHGFRIFIVVAEVGDAVGILDECALQGMGMEFSAVVQHAVPHVGCKIQPLSFFFQFFHNADALFIMFKVAADFLQRLLPHVAEGSMSQVVTQGDGLHQVLIQPEGPGHGAANLRHLQGVGHAGAVMVAPGSNVNLCFMFQAAEGIAMEYPVPVPLEIGAQRILLLLPVPAGVGGQGCPVAEDFLFQFFTSFTNHHGVPPFLEIELISFIISSGEKRFSGLTGLRPEGSQV